jgi:hypothetical protein
MCLLIEESLSICVNGRDIECFADVFRKIVVFLDAGAMGKEINLGHGKFLQTAWEVLFLRHVCVLVAQKYSIYNDKMKVNVFVVLERTRAISQDRSNIATIQLNLHEA